MKSRKKFITLILLPLFAIMVGFSYYYFSYTLDKMKNQSKILLALQDLKLINYEVETIFKLKLNYLNYDFIVEKLKTFKR